MELQVGSKIIAEYRNPYLHADRAVLATLRKERIKEVVIRSAIMLAALIIIAIMGSGGYRPHTRGDLAGIGIFLLPPLYIAYGLIGIKRSVIAMRRQQLVSTYPALHVLEQPSKTSSKSAPRLILTLWVVLVAIIAVIFAAIQWTGR